MDKPMDLSMHAPRGMRAAAALLAGCLLAACGGGKAPAAGTAVAGKAATVVRAKAAPSSDPDLVEAVAVSHEPTPVEVKFALRQHPQAGAPVPLEVVLLPNAPIDRVFASFRGEDGMTVQSGTQLGALERPEPGVPISHALVVTAPQDGIYYVSATVLTDTGTDSVARTFTIPVIVGDGMVAGSAPPALTAAHTGPAK